MTTETTLEMRTVPLDVAQLRLETRAEGQRLIVGHAAVFHSLSLDLGGFREKIMPGAFAESISADDIVALFNHDVNHVLGRNRAQTLRLQEDTRGLAFEIDVPDTQVARDLVTLIERGDVRGNSFRFVTIADQWERGDGEPDTRTLLKVRLQDISPVTFPAYPQTDVALRSLEAWRQREASARRPDERDSRLDVLAPHLRMAMASHETPKAPMERPWSAPALSDFTEEGWGELSAAQKRRIASHFVWSASGNPPTRFGDLGGPHHEAALSGVGPVNWRGLSSGRMAQASWYNDAGVRAHLARHYRQFGKTPPWEE